MQKRDVVKLVPAPSAPLCLREVQREFLKSMSRCKEDDIGRQLQLQNSCEAETYLKQRTDLVVPSLFSFTTVFELQLSSYNKTGTYVVAVR